MFSIGGTSLTPPSMEKEMMGPAVAAEIAMEYASLSAPNACPQGVYMTPSQESLLKWYGVFFVHSGPYTGAVLRFVLTFPSNFPASRPVVRFESEVFHPLIDPKTKIWHPRGKISNWQPRIHHVSDLLYDLVQSFELSALDTVLESEAANKQIWWLYHHSHHTFLSMTAQRALSTTSARVLYPTENLELTDGPPSSPKTPRGARHGRQESVSASLKSKASRETLQGDVEGWVKFKKLGEAEREGLMKMLKIGGDGG